MGQKRKDKKRRLGMPFRHEWKFYINEQSYAVLSSRLSAVLRRDSNANQYGEYMIRSLYFDDIYDSSLADKIAGLEQRDKIRVRIYNHSDFVINLERKVKSGAYISKQSCRITRDEYQSLLERDPTFLLRKGQDPAGAVYLAMRNRLLHPVKVVDYWREAFIHPIEDIRITFDKDLRMGAAKHFDIFDRNMLTVPMLDDNIMIMEVKFNQYMPGYIHRLLQGVPHDASAISKYAICRMFD